VARPPDPRARRPHHTAPPPPPPVPRPGAMALTGLAVILAGVVILAFGTSLGIADSQTLPTGVLAVLAGAALLAARLKRHRDDDHDDGAVV
jgi:uncharacterized membrane protein HdeD (DUF308 family)